MKTARMFSWARLTLTLLIALVCTSVAWAADPVSYVDENGETQTITEYTVVDQYTQFNSDRWYVVKSHVTRHDVLKTENNARIILADGASLKIGTEPAPISSASGSGLDVSGDLTIYGQEAQTGKLEVYYEGGGMWAIQVYLDMTINGGSVFVQAKMSSPYAFVVQMDKLTVNRGSLSVVAEGEGTYCYAVAATGDVSINGGSLQQQAELMVWVFLVKIFISMVEMSRLRSTELALWFMVLPLRTALFSAIPTNRIALAPVVITLTTVMSLPRMVRLSRMKMAMLSRGRLMMNG